MRVFQARVKERERQKEKREGEGEGEEGEGERQGPFISREACRNRYKNGHVQEPELHS